jgi:hypothetical protein
MAVSNVASVIEGCADKVLSHKRLLVAVPMAGQQPSHRNGHPIDGLDVVVNLERSWPRRSKGLELVTI